MNIHRWLESWLTKLEFCARQPRGAAVFTLNPKDIGRPLQDLELSYRPVELRSLIEQAYAERRSITLTSVERRFPDAEVQYFDVIAMPLYDDGNNPFGVAVSFADVSSYHRLQEKLQRAREEIQTASEELQSSNEELETTNEELHPVMKSWKQPTKSFNPPTRSSKP